MSIATIHVFPTEDARWAVESDAPHCSRSTHLSRDAAISAGVQMAIKEGAVLVVEAIDEDDCKTTERSDQHPLRPRSAPFHV